MGGDFYVPSQIGLMAMTALGTVWKGPDAMCKECHNLLEMFSMCVHMCMWQAEHRHTYLLFLN